MSYNSVIIEPQVMYHISRADPEVCLNVYTFDYCDCDVNARCSYCDVNDKVQLTTSPCLSSAPCLSGWQEARPQRLVLRVTKLLGLKKLRNFNCMGQLQQCGYPQNIVSCPPPEWVFYPTTPNPFPLLLNRICPCIVPFLGQTTQK